MYDGMTLIDAHTHMYHAGDVENIARSLACDQSRLDAVNLLSMTQYDEPYMAQNVMVLLAKARYPERCFAFGGLHHCLPGANAGDKDLARQARVLMEAGCDGIKMLEGKPTARKRIGFRLNDPVFDGFYDFMQSQGRPILSHSCDPTICWDQQKCPEAFRKCGYYYADDPFLAEKQIRDEVSSVLKKFPRLKMILAHFYLISGDIDAARRFLGEHPSALVDLTPGGEMYVDFAKDPALWREFFTAYQDRIVLGTDNSYPDQEILYPNLDGKIVDHTKGRKLNLILKFLATDETDTLFEDDDIRGLALERAAVEKIVGGNFQRVVGKTPLPLQPERCMEYARWIRDFAKRSKQSEGILADLEPVTDGLHKLWNLSGK
jgi:predicted TIM-barrel fold metal-dependent hydrolase